MKYFVSDYRSIYYKKIPSTAFLKDPNTRKRTMTRLYYLFDQQKNIVSNIPKKLTYKKAKQKIMLLPVMDHTALGPQQG